MTQPNLYRDAAMIAVCTLLCTLFFSGTSLSQTIQGRIVDAASNAPVASAVVILLDGEDRQAGIDLTTPTGAYALNAPGPGRYRVVVQRLGYEDVGSPEMDLRARGTTTELNLRARSRPLEYTPIVARVDEVCDARLEEGTAAAELWEEISKSLRIVSLAEERERVEYSIREYERLIGPRDLETSDEVFRIRRGVTANAPYTALSADRLATEGFVDVSDEAEWVYYGPDARTLLSEGFVESHCFRTVRSADDPDRIGLAFEPVGTRDVPDIRGVLWMRSGERTLESIEFEYVGLPDPAQAFGPRGHVSFEALENGLWIIDEWWIRMPVVAVPERRRGGKDALLDLSRLRPRLLHFREEGATVLSSRAVGSGGIEIPDLRAEWIGAEPDPEERRIVGEPGPVESPRGVPRVTLLAIDVTTDEPAPGVEILVGDSLLGTTGQDGRVHLEELPPGRHEIGVQRSGYAPLEAAFDLSPGEEGRILQIPMTPDAILVDPIEVTIDADPIRRAVGEAAYRITADEIPDHTPATVLELMASRIQGVHLQRQRGQARRQGGRTILDSGCSFFATRNGIVEFAIVDGIRYGLDSYGCVLEALNPLEIAEITVLIGYAGQTRYARPGGGVILVETKRGEKALRR